MKQFEYTIKSELGIHARPAGMISKIARCGNSICTLTRGDDSADLRKVFALMSLGVKCGERITVQVEGDDEDVIFSRLLEIFQESL